MAFWRPITARFAKETQGGVYGPIGHFQSRLHGRTGTALGIVMLGLMMVGVGALAVHTCLSAA